MNTLKVNPDDNLLVALCDLPKGVLIEDGDQQFVLQEDIPAKHKMAVRNLAEGEDLKMYGVRVGVALHAIPAGGLISTQNTKHATNAYQVNAQGKIDWHTPDVKRWASATFMGYRRSDGKVGTANYWLVIPLVFCENRNVEAMKDAFTDLLSSGKRTDYRRYLYQLLTHYQGSKNVDELLQFEPEEEEEQQSEAAVFKNINGVKFLTHSLGCGGTRDDASALCGLLAGYITHPNVAGATVLSLGCQNAQISLLKEEIEKRLPGYDRPLYFLEQQAIGSERKMLRKALKLTLTGLIRADQQEREPAALDKLCIGVECGGSDGFSGISANPAVGKVADMLVALGGSVVLSEFPELCGVEQDLSDRCVNEQLARRFVQLVQNYQKRAEAVGSGFDANPSPGNIKDGLITDAIKSAGAARKGGTSPVMDVLDYPEWVKKPGLNLLCTPGNDVESTTAMVGAGANMVLFTTGLGTPTGNPVAPVVKIASNTTLSEKMQDIIDINTGTIIEGKESLDDVSDRMIAYILEVASGRLKTKAQQLEQDDFIPWKRGVSL